MSAMIRSPYEKGGFGVPRQLDEAEKNGVDFLSFLGVSTIEEARELDAFYIRDRYAAYREAASFMGPVVDDRFCFGDLSCAFYAGKKRGCAGNGG